MKHNALISAHTLSALTLSVLSAFALTACGNDNKPTSQDNKTQNSSVDNKGGSADGSVAKSKDPTTLTINNGAEISSLDPHKTGGVPESNVARQQFVGLTTTDADGNVIGGVATSWESSDNKVWKFTLRDSKWSDGSPLTADDVVFSFQRMVDPKTAANFANYIADSKFLNAQDIIEGKKDKSELGIKKLDDKTIEITLSEPVPYFPDMMTYTATRIVPKAVVEKLGDEWSKPENIVVNGAYKIKDWVAGEKMVFAKNPHHYDADKVKIDNLVLLFIDSGTTDFTRYKTDEIDITSTDIPSETLATANKDEVKTGASLCSYFYEMNVKKPPFDDVRVRRALSMALDRDTITTKVSAKGETPAYQMTPNVTANNPNYAPEWAKLSFDERVAEAKKLLNEAGYNEQKPLEFELLYNTSENHKKVAVAAQSLWQQSLGFVKVNLVNQEWKAYLASRRNHEHQMARASWCGDYNDPATFLNVMRTKGSGNYGNYASQEYDDLLKSSLLTKTTDERVAIYKQLEGVLDKDTPNIWVYHQVNSRVVKPYVEGYSTKDPLGSWQAKYWSLK